MGPGPIYSLGQKQRVFEPYSLSLSSMVAVAISQNLCPEHSNQLSRKWKCLLSTIINVLEKMGPGPMFCCYVLKLRMSSFLQNGACPHFFLTVKKIKLRYSFSPFFLKGGVFLTRIIMDINMIFDGKDKPP